MNSNSITKKVLSVVGYMIILVFATISAHYRLGPIFWPTDYQRGMNFYLGINGVSQDYETAVKWFRKAADQENVYIS